MNLMKTSRTLAAIAFATLGFASSSQAGVTAVFSAGTSCSGANFANFATGGPIVQVSLCATTDAATRTCGHTIVLQSATAGESGAFKVAARALGSNYADPNSEVLLTPLAINNPAAAADFGGTVVTQVPVATAANQLLATFDLAPQSTALNNSYVISLAPASIVAVNADTAIPPDTNCGGTTVPTEAPITASFTLNRILTPTFTSAAATTFALNAANTFNVTASGNAPITFSAGAGLPGTVTLSSAGVLSGTPTANGTFPVVITATGTGTVTQNFVLTVSGQATQSISFTNPGSRPFSSTPIPLSATATSGLAVTFTSNTLGVCSVSGTNATMLTLGTCTLTATQGGNATFLAAAPVQVSFGITGAVPGAPTIGTVTNGSGQATISFTPPGSNGGSPITGYAMTCGGISATGPVSPITVTGLTNNQTYSCSVTAANSLGSGPSSGTVTAAPLASIALALVGVQSRKVHGTAGTFDHPIALGVAIGGAITVEPRGALVASQANHSIVFQFNGPVASLVSVTSLDALNAPVGTVGVPTFAGNEVTIPLTAVTNQRRAAITLTGVTGPSGTANATVTMGFLSGDVAPPFADITATLDILTVKIGGRLGAVNNSNFLSDLDVNGSIGSVDVLISKLRGGRSLP